MVVAGVHEGKSEICARVGYYNLGVNLCTETPTSEQVREAVESVISNDSYAQNVERVSEEINSYDAHALLCAAHT